MLLGLTEFSREKTINITFIKSSTCMKNVNFHYLLSETLWNLSIKKRTNIYSIQNNESKHHVFQSPSDNIQEQTKLNKLTI